MFCVDKERGKLKCPQVHIDKDVVEFVEFIVSAARVVLGI